MYQFPAIGLRAKIVECERLLPAGNEFSHLILETAVLGADGNHWEYGAENLIGHDGGIGFDIVKQGGLNESGVAVSAAAIYYVAVLQITLDAFKCLVGDQAYKML